jgi:two-component system chemotaxis sensor kinase CheA
LSSLDVLTVEVDGQLAAVPLEAVRRSLRVAPQDVTSSTDGEAIEHEGSLIPMRTLWLGGARNAQRLPSGRTRPALVLHAAGVTAALAVDRLHGTETVVLRPLPVLAPADAAIAGMHLDADGNPRLVLAPEALVSAARLASAADPAPASPARPILIVDDSLTTRMLESSILESAGFDVAMASSGEEGLAMARNGRFGLFLVDVEMPGMDGFGFIERTRADPQLREVPCILVTSRDSPDDKRRGQAAGACAHIVKNEFDQAAFLAHVERLVGGTARSARVRQ